MSRTLSLRGGGGGNSSLTLTAPEISLEGALSGGDAALILNPTNRLTLAADATLAGRSITLDGDANWSAGTLTLDADQEITINGVLNATGSAGFAANYAETDANHAGLIFQHASGAYRGGINIAADAVTLNGKTYSVLHTKGDLAALADDPAKNYVLGGDIAGLALSDLGSLGFVSGQEKYAGRFNGFGHTLSVSATSLENGVSPVALHGTRLLLSSPGDLDVNAPLTWQSGILALAAQGDININAPLTWLGTTYTAPHPLGDNAGLALNAQKNVRVNAAVTAGVLRPNYAYGYFTTRTWATLEINTGHAVNAATGAANLAASTAGQNADGTPWGLYMAYGVTGKVAASSNPGGFSGKINLYTTNSLRINGEDYTVINSQAEMEAIRENPGGNYALGVDPNSTGGNRQYTGYGTEAAPFTGHFNGLGHAMATGSGNSSGLFGVIGAGGAVSNLGVGGSVFYNNGADWAGTVAAKNYGSILQVFSTDQAGGVAGGAGGVPTGGMGVGGLVGYNNGLLANSFTYYQSGSGVVGIAGTQYAGGLVAYNDTEGRILNSYTTNKDSAAGTTFMGGAMNVANSILPDLAAGGLVGFNAGEIANSYALNGITLGVANTGGNIGGLVGVNADTGRIRNAYTAAHGITGDVANDIPLNIGSFAGENRGVIEASYAATPINARTFTVDTSDVLASAWSKSGSYNNLYLTPEIFGDTSSVVVTNEDGSITYEAGAGKDYTVSGVSYLRTTVSSKITYGQTLKVTYPHKNFEHGEMGATKLAGFVGNNTGSVTNGYFDTALTKMAQGGDSGVTALEAAAAQSLASYAGFDSGVWGASAEGHPILKTLPVYIVNPGFTSNPPVITYGDDERAKLYAVGLQWSASPVSLIPAEGFSGRGEARNATGQLNAGGHAARAAFSSDYYGNLAGAFSIAPKTLALPATNLVQDKVYDGTTSATLVDGVETALRATLVGDENLTFHVNARFARKDAGNYDVPVTVTLADGNGENAGLARNYNVLSTATSRAAITPKALSAEGFTVADKVYDGSASASAAVVGAVTGILPDDPVTVGAVTGQFDDALAGEDKPVSIVAHLTGAGAGNYTLTGSATGRIAPRPVEIEGATTATGSVEVAASGLQVANRVSGDNLALSGSVTLEGAAPGVQGVTGFSNLLLDNTNYTTEGATGRVALEAPQPYPANGNLPTGFALQSGEASESVAGNAMTIAQESQKAVIHWDTFDIGAGYSVAFDQKHGAAAVALNRVTGGAQSLIDGALTAPGQVFILNSAGVLFNAGSSVNAGALVASTLDMRDSNFLAGNYLLENTWSGGRVEARGVITVAEGGYAALVSGGKEGSGVTHTGTTTAKGGALLLAGGEDIRLLLDTDTARLSGFEAATQGEPVQLGGTLDISSENGAGGVLYTTHRVGTDDDLAVESGGKDGQDGRWKLETDGYVLGELVSRALELVDVEVASRENDMMVNDAIAWDRHTLTLSSPRNILVNAVLTATGTASFAANHGTGTNARGAYLGSPYGLYMGFGALGSSGGNDVSDFDDLERGVFAGKIDFSSRGTVRLNGDLYTVIYGREGYWPDGVLAMNANPDGRYVLGSDIHIGDDDGRAVPIGTAETPFAGSFEGFGHVIDNLHGGGLFGQIGATGSVSNFGVQVGSTILGNTGPNSGILADVNQGRVTNSFAGGLSYLDLGNNYYDYNFSVWPEGKGGASGGLVGVNHGLITGSYAYAHVGRNRALGGLVGTNETGGRIINSFALSDFPVNSIVSEYVGGLVGINKGEISGSFSDSEFIDGSSISYSNIDGRAGFVGWNTSTGVIENAWSNAIVAGDGGNGAGFVAINDGLVRNAYATGTVGEGPNQFGNGGTMGRFLAGFVYTNTGVIENAYTTAQILTENNATYGKPERSAFAHENTGTIINAYWDKTLVAQGATDSARAADGDTIADHTGDTNGSAAVGLSAANAKLLASYVGFDPAFWGSSLNGHPILKTLPVVASATVVGEYGATPSTATLATRGLQWGDTAASLLAYAPDAALLSASGFLDAGVYDLAQVFSWPSLYDDVSGALLIAPRRLTLAQTGIARGKTYDGDTAAEVAASAANGGLVGLVGGETLGVAYVDARFKDKNAGENKAVRFAAVRLADGENGGQAANYTIARKPLTDAIVTTLADIAPREISASYAVSDKVYDGDTTARVTAQDLAGLVAGDEVRALATGQFADAHAETGKAVAITASLQGGDAANYRLLPAAAGVASIAARPLELQAVLASGSEPYVVNASDITILNRVGEDDVGLAGSGVVTAGAVGEHDMALNNLGVANPDYTLAGATGKALVGDALLPHTPSGADYTAGRVTVSTSGNTMTVDQSVDRALINWMGFSIGVGHAVDFVQPGQGAVTLNRVTGSEKSLIAGAITAPGQVYIINPRGVLFTGASSVDVGALVAATQDIADADFMAGVLRFGVIPGAIPGVEQAGGIEAHGSITTGENGYVALLGNTITHRGATTAPGGAIALVGGSDITLTLDTTTGALRDVWAGNDGNDASALRVGGKLDVASVTGEAGRILTQGGLALEGGTRIDATGEDGAAGVWRLARAGDFRVDGEDENATTRGETLTRLLETLDVHVESKTGDVNVEDAIQWNKNTLTLAAARNVNIGDTLRVTDAGNLTAFYGESSIRADKNAPGIILGDLDARLYGVNMAFAKYADGTDADRFAGKVDFSGSGELKMGVAGKTPNTYTVIDSIAGLQAIDTNLAGFYALGRDLDLTGIDWTPLGALEGSLDGLGHVIHNLASTRGGLFNSSLQAAVQMNALSDFYDPSKGPDIPRPVADQPKISNLGLADISLIVQNPSGFAVGGLSNAYYGIAENDFVTGEIIVTKDVAGHSSVGGMFGKTGTVNQGGVSIVANSYAKVDIHADGVFYVGGFVGATDESYITNSYAAGNVDGGTGVFKGPSGAPVQGTGGFVGQNAYNSIISRSHAYGDVTGVGQVGGFVGVNQGQAAILGSSASGHAHLADMGLLLGGYDPAYGPSVGGFAGWNYHGSIQNSSSSGLVTSGSSAEGGGWVGGFAGYTHVDHDGTSFSYGNVFDKDTAGVDHDGGGNGVLPMGNHHHDGGGSGTPILDAYNAKYGTNLTPEQFHAGAVGVSSGEFAAIQQQQATDPGAAAKAYETALNSATGGNTGGNPGDNTGGNTGHNSGDNTGGNTGTPGTGTGETEGAGTDGTGGTGTDGTGTGETGGAGADGTGIGGTEPGGIAEPGASPGNTGDASGSAPGDTGGAGTQPTAAEDARAISANIQQESAARAQAAAFRSGAGFGLSFGDNAPPVAENLRILDQNYVADVEDIEIDGRRFDLRDCDTPQDETCKK